ncbi:hypothetical protein CRYUN_Cryun37aG0046300 [Craigia yunnanensis]
MFFCFVAASGTSRPSSARGQWMMVVRLRGGHELRGYWRKEGQPKVGKPQLTSIQSDGAEIEGFWADYVSVLVDLIEYVEKHEFVFDAVLNEEVSNDEVYRETVEPLVPTNFQHTKATSFAYGETGSGKTYTMKPLPLKASRDILRLMHHTYRNQGFQLFVSFFEIYGGKIFDLLSDRKKLCMREDGKQKVCIVGLQEHRVSDVETIKELIEKGNATRGTGTTGANEESSRSHAILQLAIKRSVDGSELKPPRVVGKLSFIDLAGSERGADTTDNDKLTRMEGAEIKKSLLALKECIRALDNDQGHIPFRGNDDLNVFLQEEEDLVNALRKQVEETMNIVKEEMNLLVESDQPGNQLDNYISRLNAILSQKAAGITQLQTRLAHFQKRLKEHNALVSSSGY